MLVIQSCPTLCNHKDCSLPGSVHGILQARILKWVAISSFDPEIEPASSPLQADSLLLVHWWSPNFLGQKKEYALWEALGFFTYFIGDQWKISSRWALILYMDRSFRTSNVMHFYELDLRKLSLFLLARCWKHITDWYSLWGSCSQPLASALPRAP